MPIFQIVIRRKHSGGQFVFGVPMFAIWLLLAPFALLLLPFFLLACLLCGINPLPPLSALCSLLKSLEGTQVEFDDGHRTFELRVA